MSSNEQHMPDNLFQDMVAGVEQMVAIEKGHKIPDPKRVHEWTLVDVKRVRKSTATTQSQFAQLLGVGVDTIKSWESGRRHPSGSAAKLLTLLSKDPVGRAKELAQT